MCSQEIIYTQVNVKYSLVLTFTFAHSEVKVFVNSSIGSELPWTAGAEVCTFNKVGPGLVDPDDVGRGGIWRAGSAVDGQGYTKVTKPLYWRFTRFRSLAHRAVIFCSSAIMIIKEDIEGMAAILCDRVSGPEVWNT